MRRALVALSFAFLLAVAAALTVAECDALIQTAVDTSATTLTLDGCAYTGPDISAALWTATSLTSLTIRNAANMTSVPAGIGNLTGLTSCYGEA